MHLPKCEATLHRGPRMKQVWRGADDAALAPIIAQRSPGEETQTIPCLRAAPIEVRSLPHVERNDAPCGRSTHCVRRPGRGGARGGAPGAPPGRGRLPRRGRRAAAWRRLARRRAGRRRRDHRAVPPGPAALTRRRAAACRPPAAASRGARPQSRVHDGDLRGVRRAAGRRAPRDHDAWRPVLRGAAASPARAACRGHAEPWAGCRLTPPGGRPRDAVSPAGRPCDGDSQRRAVGSARHTRTAPRVGTRRRRTPAGRGGEPVSGQRSLPAARCREPVAANASHNPRGDRGPRTRGAGVDGAGAAPGARRAGSPARSAGRRPQPAVLGGRIRAPVAVRGAAPRHARGDVGWTSDRGDRRR